MFDTGKHKFSNPLATYRQYTNKAHHSRSPLTDRTHQNLVNRSKSPVNGHKKDFCSWIDGVQEYKRSNKTKFSDQKMKKIVHTLFIEATTQQNYQKRLNNKTMYVDYHYNPFLIERSDEKKSKKFRKEDNQNIVRQTIKNMTVKTLVHQVNDLYLKVSDRKVFDQLKIPNTRLNDVLKRQLNKTDLRKLHKIHDYSKIIDKAEVIDIEIANPFQDLDNIVMIKQKNYNQKIVKSESFNVFKVICNDNDKNMMNSKEILKKYNLCHDHVDVKSRSTKTINVFKHLSNNSRMIHLKMGKIVPSSFKINELSEVIETQNIYFDGLMFISNGILQPDMLNSFLSGDISKRGFNQQKQESSLVAQDNQINYKDNTKNTETNKHGQNYDIFQKNYYIDETLTADQKRQEQLSINYKDRLQKVLRIQSNLNANFINDQKIQNKIKEYKQKILLTQLDNYYDPIYTKTDRDLDRLIRYNKCNKNRGHRIKVSTTEESLKMQKIYDQKITQKKLQKKDKELDNNAKYLMDQLFKSTL